jgi:hypothetical protein
MRQINELCDAGKEPIKMAEDSAFAKTMDPIWNHY